jgi:hypothetical protein
MRGPLIAGLAVCLIYAAAALANGAGRMAWPVLPHPLSPVAVQHAAATALINSQAAALPLAAQVVRSDPLNGHAVGMLGVAALLSGNADRAVHVFEQGERLGRRDVPTRSFAFEQDAAAGRWREAGQHVEAMLRAHPDLRVKEGMLTRLEEQPAGRRALTEMLRKNPEWMARHFAAPDISDAALAIRAAWLTADQTGAVGCLSTRPLVDRLLERGMRGVAGRVWQAHCDARPLPLLADAGFAGLATGRSDGPFDWQAHPAEDVTLSFANATGRGLTAKTAASTPRLILTQPTAWPAGAYTVESAGLGRGGRFLLSLDCGRTARRPQEPMLSEHRQVLRAGDCEQTLGLWVTPGVSEAVLSELTIARR